jgi:hypothetical protein
MNYVAVMVWGIVLMAAGAIIFYLAVVPRHANRQRANHDKQLRAAIGVGKNRDTTDWIPLIKSIGRHRP